MEQRRIGRELSPLERRRRPYEIAATCSFDGCSKPDDRGGLCSGHREQKRQGKTLRALIPRRAPAEATARDEMGRKQCFACHEWKPEAEYGGRRSAADGLDSRCRRCRFSESLRGKYGIDADEYDALLLSQGGGCAICSRPPRGRRLAVDHDHACCPGERSCGACVRGLLCMGCNTTLGVVGDDVAILRRAAEYLEANR